MKTINLTQNNSVIVNDIDYKNVGMFKWRTGGSRLLYAVREIWNKGNRYTEHMHRVILEKKIGRKLIKGEIAEHLNGNGLDNRRRNLRVGNQTLNLANSHIRIDNTSGHKGIYWDKSRNNWQAYINFNKKRYHLGRFKKKEDAIKVYDKKAKELFGKFARLK